MISYDHVGVVVGPGVLTIEPNIQNRPAKDTDERVLSRARSLVDGAISEESFGQAACQVGGSTVVPWWL